MREQLKEVWRNILKKDYSEDTIATIMYLLIKTQTPEKTLNEVIKVLGKNLEEEKMYQELNNIDIKESETNE